MVQKTLHFIFLDLRKAYDTVDRKQLLEIFEEYGVGPNILGLLKFYWDHQPCVAKSKNYHRETFVLFCGATPGGIVFPTLFNVIVDAVIWKWYTDVMNDVSATNTGLSGDNIGRLASLFYADDDAIGCLDHEWLQNANQNL